MFDVFGSVKGLLKLDAVNIDNNIFRLHYKVGGDVISDVLLLSQSVPQTMPSAIGNGCT